GRCSDCHSQRRQGGAVCTARGSGASRRFVRERIRPRLGRVGTRLTVAFLAVSLLTPLVGLVAISADVSVSRRAARIEAEHLAETVAETITRVDADGTVALYRQGQRLQQYIADLHRTLRRDIEVLDDKLRILADAIPQNRGSRFEGTGER